MEELGVLCPWRRKMGCEGGSWGGLSTFRGWEDPVIRTFQDLGRGFLGRAVQVTYRGQLL